ncbi:hypothetical protein Hsw_0638 [Hymenobacter swuensis DY53]|uniref:Uncharacterized protein n=2 Tax=Hymenobacter TaxID=89966 RepID=W8EUM1_9BACT|nr:hypothetical protein Hsw_0638 [Hymenobacter swuensis DY53]
MVILTGCSLYAPLQPSAPLIHIKGEAEVVASGYFSGRVEGSAAYSPLKYVVVRAAGGLKTNGTDSLYYRIRQLESSIGTYRRLGDGWLLGAMMGYGLGKGGARYYDDFQKALPDSVPLRLYRYSFRKPHVEAYVSHQSRWTTVGASCRFSQVRFANFTDRGQPVPLHRMSRLEPSVFLRLGGADVLPWLQGQVVLSLSMAAGGRTHSPDKAIYAMKMEPAFTSFGFVIYPHRFKE